MHKTKLRSEQNTPEMQFEVENLGHDVLYGEHDNLSAAFEHGQWWVLCGACGASWSVVDETNQRNSDLALEQIDTGDESCPQEEV